MIEAVAVNGEETVNIFILVKRSKTLGASSLDSNTSAFSREAAVSTVKKSGTCSYLQLIQTRVILQFTDAITSRHLGAHSGVT
jgi:hypothetical protein